MIDTVHVGLPESVDFIAHRLSWTLERREETLEPVAAEKQIDSGYKPIAKGMACGVNGDIATCAITLNAVRSILQAGPGLRTMADIPPIAFFNETAVR